MFHPLTPICAVYIMFILVEFNFSLTMQESDDLKHLYYKIFIDINSYLEISTLDSFKLSGVLKQE